MRTKDHDEWNDDYTYFELLFMVFEYIWDFGSERVKAESLYWPWVGTGIHNKYYMRTLRASMIWLGAIVFFESCSQISFASDDMRCINSETLGQNELLLNELV